MKKFLLERGGKFSDVPIDVIVSMITPESAATLFDDMSCKRKVRLNFPDKPYFGFLRHNEDISTQKPKGNVVPGLYCVEILWVMPVETSVLVQAHNEEEAKDNFHSEMHANLSGALTFLYEEVEDTFRTFNPDIKNAIVIPDNVVSVSREVYADVKSLIVKEE